MSDIQRVVLKEKNYEFSYFTASSHWRFKAIISLIILVSVFLSFLLRNIFLFKINTIVENLEKQTKLLQSAIRILESKNDNLVRPDNT